MYFQDYDKAFSGLWNSDAVKSVLKGAGDSYYDIVSGTGTAPNTVYTSNSAHTKYRIRYYGASCMNNDGVAHCSGLLIDGFNPWIRVTGSTINPSRPGNALYVTNTDGYLPSVSGDSRSGCDGTLL